MGRFHKHPDGTVHEHDDGDHSGYGATGTVRVEVLERILYENDRVAAINRQAFTEAGLISVNLMSSPGAGKTTLLKRTLGEIGGGRPAGGPRAGVSTRPGRPPSGGR